MNPFSLSFKRKTFKIGWYSIFYSVLTFFIVFSFPVLPFFSSAKIVMLVVFIQLLVHRDFCRQLNEFRKWGNHFSQIYFFIFFYAILITVFTLANDYSLVFKIISGYIFYIVCFLFFRSASAYINLRRTLVYCFLIQSLLIILAIFSESFFTMTAPFRGGMGALDELTYGRLRGNAICGYQFFSVAAMFSFITLYLILHLKDFRYGGLMMIPVCVASVCSGRYSIVGIAIGIGVYMLREVRNGRIDKILAVILIAVSSLVIAVTVLYNNVDNITDPVASKVVQNYLIDPLDSVLKGGTFESASTDRLKEMAQDEEIKQYFWLGAGRYTNPDGHYFGGVDIGYYRMLGYFGVLGFLLISYALYYLIYKTNSNLDIYTKHAIFLNFIVLNIKGDVQVFSNNIIPVVMALLLSNASMFTNTRKE